MKCRQPKTKRLGESASKNVDNTIGGLENVKIKVWATDESVAINLKTYKRWLNTIEFELKSTRISSSNVAVVRTPALNIAKRSEVLDELLRPDRLYSNGGRSMVLVVKSQMSFTSYCVCKESQYSRCSNYPAKLVPRQK